MFIHFHAKDDEIVLNTDHIVSISYFEYIGEPRIRIDLTKGYIIAGFSDEDDRDMIMNSIAEFIENHREYVHVSAKSLTIEN